MTTLVLAAYAPELDGLAGNFLIREVGIGAIEASAGAERAIAETKPTLVILVGTAGSLPGFDREPASVVVARRARLVIREGEYLPEPMRVYADADRELAGRLSVELGAPLVEVACPIGITSSNLEAARLAALGCDVEQLECFAVFRAAERALVPAVALFALANRVGADAAAEWRANRVVAEAAARAALLRAVAEK